MNSLSGNPGRLAYFYYPKAAGIHNTLPIVVFPHGGGDALLADITKNNGNDNQPWAIDLAEGNVTGIGQVNVIFYAYALSAAATINSSLTGGACGSPCTFAITARNQNFFPLAAPYTLKLGETGAGAESLPVTGQTGTYPNFIVTVSSGYANNHTSGDFAYVVESAYPNSHYDNAEFFSSLITNAGNNGTQIFPGDVNRLYIAGPSHATDEIQTMLIAGDAILDECVVNGKCQWTTHFQSYLQRARVVNWSLVADHACLGAGLQLLLNAQPGAPTQDGTEPYYTSSLFGNTATLTTLSIGANNSCVTTGTNPTFTTARNASAISGYPGSTYGTYQYATASWLPPQLFIRGYADNDVGVIQQMWYCASAPNTTCYQMPNPAGHTLDLNDAGTGKASLTSLAYKNTMFWFSPWGSYPFTSIDNSVLVTMRPTASSAVGGSAIW